VHICEIGRRIAPLHARLGHAPAAKLQAWLQEGNFQCAPLDGMGFPRRRRACSAAQNARNVGKRTSLRIERFIGFILSVCPNETIDRVPVPD